MSTSFKKHSLYTGSFLTCQRHDEKCILKVAFFLAPKHWPVVMTECHFFFEKRHKSSKLDCSVIKNHKEVILQYIYDPAVSQKGHIVRKLDSENFQASESAVSI